MNASSMRSGTFLYCDASSPIWSSSLERRGVAGVGVEAGAGAAGAADGAEAGAGDAATAAAYVEPAVLVGSGIGP